MSPDEIVCVLLWLLLLEILSAISLPVALNLNFYSISKALSMILFSSFLWYLGRVEFSISTILLSFLLVALLSLSLSGNFKIEMRRFLKLELIFISAFLFFLFLRALSPEILHTGGEKFMEFAILNSVLRTEKLPLEDVWFSGAEINYYYLGYILFGSLIRLLDIPPEIGFNLATATVPAITASMAYEFGERLSSKRFGGISLLYFICFAGSLRLSPNYWGFSRIIPGTINEFPAFSFLHADLHPHMISIPFQLLAAILLYELKERKSTESFILLLILLNSFILLNTWEFPTYIFLSFLILLLNREFRKILLLPLPLMIFLPFKTSFFERSLGTVSERTDLFSYFLFLGLLLLIIYLGILRKFRKSDVLIIPLSILLLFSGFHVLAILIPLLPPLLREKENFENILILGGILISIFFELFYIDDPLSYPYERMNTVFKLGLQNWILWSIPASKFISNFGKRELSAIFIPLLLSSSFLVVGISEKALRCDEITLDGLEELKRHHPADIEAAEILKERERGVILELYGDSYTYSSQFSTLTGYPSVLGWRGHEIMWRGWDAVEKRQSDILEMYRGNTTLMKEYSVKYIIFGEREREIFGEFPLNLTQIYQKGNLTVYEL
ncbi:MAG: hypothetical protein PWR13_142 [Archaeoglobi archaeon]|nr:hypothetical protein [Archaeoglobi archaeon]